MKSYKLLLRGHSYLIQADLTVEELVAKASDCMNENAWCSYLKQNGQRVVVNSRDIVGFEEY